MLNARYAARSTAHPTKMQRTVDAQERLAVLKHLFGGDAEAVLDLLDDYQPQLRRTTTVAEFANIVGISRSLAYQIVSEKRVRSLRIRGRIVIPRSAIDDFLEGRADETPTR